MARAHLFELHDQPWFPAVWRDLLTDYLAFYVDAFRPYERVAPLLAAAIRDASANRIVDLCSGAGAAILSLRGGFERSGASELEITLTDKFPNLPAWRRAAAETGGAVSFEPRPVDAAAVPCHLDGFRTLFTSLHHFRPEEARSVLSDAVETAAGVGAFEYTERNWLVWGLPVLLIPAFIWLTTPLMRPVSWRRFLWTYLVPVVPLVAMWDGFVSNLRTYSVEELEDLIAPLRGDRFIWRVGRVRSVGLSRVTYVVGWRSGDHSPGSGP